ncbi:hypothetical protein RvY_04904 [Ramazzottius varieornatus]|uniref:Uncharacterized protein n=1 Tax=Ramazzottius varieornatus TaxID=947166 RepID=A0A1D1UWE4_RAMVA|nr:hypothetical protein RvY_04904 [Ramazzottius varieornatus]
MLDEGVRKIVLAALESRWAKFYDPELMVCAMVLHPKVKMSSFRADHSTLRIGPFDVICTKLYIKLFGKNPGKQGQSLVHYLTNRNVFEPKYASHFDNPFDFWEYTSAAHKELAELAVWEDFGVRWMEYTIQKRTAWEWSLQLDFLPLGWSYAVDDPQLEDLEKEVGEEAGVEDAAELVRDSVTVDFFTLNDSFGYKPPVEQNM